MGSEKLILDINNFIGLTFTIERFYKIGCYIILGIASARIPTQELAMDYLVYLW